MDITIDRLIPIPLQEKSDLHSDIWLKKITFKNATSNFVAAPSGSGKTTFTHILYGLRNDFEGDAIISERSIKSLSLNDWIALRRDQLSIIFQDLRLFPEFTGWENIMLKARLVPLLEEHEIQQMADKFGISGLLNKQCKFMSQGERQRVAIIRALTQPFEWLLMDEPFSHLDENNINIGKDLITEACKRRSAGMILCSLGDSYGLHYDFEYKL